MVLRGKPVRVSTPNGYWSGRAFTNPLWVDCNGRRWVAGGALFPPSDAVINDPDRPPLLHVGVTTEQGWVRWAAAVATDTVTADDWPPVTYYRASTVWVDVETP
jgi:hypothetical protein